MSVFKRLSNIFIITIVLQLLSCTHKNKPKVSILDYFKEYYGVKPPEDSEIYIDTNNLSGIKTIGYHVNGELQGISIKQEVNGDLLEIKDYIRSASDNAIILNQWVFFKPNNLVDYDRSAFVYSTSKGDTATFIYGVKDVDSIVIYFPIEHDMALDIVIPANEHYCSTSLMGYKAECNNSNTINRDYKFKAYTKNDEGGFYLQGIHFDCHCK